MTSENAAKAATKVDPAQVAWFGQFGYTGADDEVVTLRNDLGTAKAQDVWSVLQGLRRLEEDYNAQFNRTANSAHDNRRLVDVAKRLTQDEYGELTDYASGEWRPGRREIVVALLDLSEVDETSVAAFAETPLVAAKSA